MMIQQGWEQGREIAAKTLRQLERGTPNELKVLARIAHTVVRRAANDVQRKVRPHLTPPNLLSASFLLLFLLGRKFMGVNAWCLILYGLLSWVLTTISSLLLGWSSFIYQKNFSSKKIAKHQEIPMEGALILIAMLIQGSVFGVGSAYVMSCFSRSGESAKSLLMGRKRDQMIEQALLGRRDGISEERRSR